jgi:hypothetical protein
VKYKIGLCHLAVHDTRSALSEVLLYPSPLVYTHPILSCNLTVLLVVLVAWCFVEILTGMKLYHFFPLWFAWQECLALILQIEGIPSKAKTLRINMTLAKLYRMTGYDRAATAAYKECLRFLLLLHFFSSVANLFVLSILHSHVLNPCSPTAYFELYISIEMDVVVAGDLVWLYGLLAQLMRQIPSLLFFLSFFFSIWHSFELGWWWWWI